MKKALKTSKNSFNLSALLYTVKVRQFQLFGFKRGVTHNVL